MTGVKKGKNKKKSVKNDERYKELDSLISGESEIGNNSRWGCAKRICKLIGNEMRNNLYVYLLSILYLCVCVMNKVFAKRTLNKMGNYSFVTSEVHNIICIIVFQLLYFIYRKTSKSYESSNESQKSFGWQFFLISLLDASTVIITMIGLTRTTGNIQSFIMQLIIPVNMYFCFMFLGYRYHLFNYLGAFIILITIAAVETVLSFETQSDNSIIFNLIMISALIPLSFSNMTREVVFKKHKINIIRLNAMVVLFQFFTSLLVLPVYNIPFLKEIYMPFSEMGTNINDGLRCLFYGQSTIVENCGVGMVKMCDQCEGAWKTFITFSFFNICDNLLACYIIDQFSTMTYTIVSCIQGPAITIAYYFKFLAGDAVRQPRLLDFITLFGYLFGTIIYRIGNIVLEKKKMLKSQNNNESEAELTSIETSVA
ncbi:chloroquine resistance transporter [Plasmodium vinckei petteri]|uniref:Chloroquine resistance transporter n=1 Tax=Plasmodium vinckei petteri TaxID=138298 RepID=W7AV82_PLAVN|nr:chloroquine resistance transporter [Plasmodium vinckei petteri]CAD2109634.1 chloroquine resistance transporter, putative [Plasmodium vinckei petteri]